MISYAALVKHPVDRNHAFIDGNKRTALTATDVFFRANGRALGVDDYTQLVDLTVGVAEGKISLEECAERFESWLVLPRQVSKCPVTLASRTLMEL